MGMGENASLEFLPQPTRRGAALLPGLPVLPPGVERTPIKGGGTLLCRLAAGDHILVCDPEGLQSCQMAVFGADGRSDPARVGATGSGPAAALTAMIRHASRMRDRMSRLGLDLHGMVGIDVFDGSGPADSQARFTAEQPVHILIGAPGGPMAPDAQNPPTGLVVFITRTQAPVGKPALMLPEPLADPLEEWLLEPGTARGYPVKAGRLLQITDVRGRECSDFQAFSRRGLDRGHERSIDPTTTRSLTATLYPAPGLFSKYFTVDHEPLLEIVQDTCGRHDSYGLACTARYYEDLGYPGHVNCSDNLNPEAERFALPPRRGWPAINFFFNTAIDAANAFGFDEPYSRPGDYVLLRALTDLICFSTACPCDIDPANGWSPSEILVRTYDGAVDAPRAVGFRMTEDAAPELTKQTGFHPKFAEHTRNFTEYNGYWLARDITGRGAIEEYWACRERAVITDLSPLRKYEIVGPDAEALLQLCLTRNIKKLSQGQVVYSAVCHEHGGMIDDGTVFRLGDNNFRWIGGNDLSGLWLREQAQKQGLAAWVKTSTEQLCNLALQGRRSRAILADLTWTPPTQPTIAELGWFRFTIGRLRDFDGPALVISRTGYTGELGYEIFCHPKDAAEIFDAIWTAGIPHGLAPLGLAALDMLRIESGLIFAGAEFDDTIDPFEAGIGFTVPLQSKQDDFIGRPALERRKAHPSRKLVGLEIDGGTVPTSGDSIRLGRARIGEITSATRSPLLGQTIALARLDAAHTAVGTEVQVGQLDGQQKRLPARVVPFPHFDPTKSRVRGEY